LQVVYIIEEEDEVSKQIVPLILEKVASPEP